MTSTDKCRMTAITALTLKETELALHRESRTFPNFGVFDLPKFWFSYSCLVYVTKYYFRNGCQLFKHALVKYMLMGKFSVQTKLHSSHKIVQTFSQLCYVIYIV